MLKNPLTISIAAIALAACSAETEPTATEPTGSPAGTPIPVEPDGGIGDGAGSPPVVEAEGTIPNRFIGVWDYIKGTCDPASDMRLEIGQDEFRFYESIGTVTGFRAEGEAIIVDLDMEGEGETWTQSLRLVLKDEGTRLHVTEPQKESEIDDYPRRRCPVQGG